MRTVRNLLPAARAICRTADSREPRNLSLREFENANLSDLRPLAGLPSWIGKQSYEGRWWFSCTGEHVAFASGWEREVIMVLDFAGDTAALQRDTVMILSPYIPGHPPHSPVQPWLYVESVDHQKTLMLGRADGDRSSELEGLLSDTRIAVAVPKLPSVDEMRGIRWLAGYRFTRFRLPQEAEFVIREACATALTLGFAVRTCAAAVGIDVSAVLANIYSQLWRGHLRLLEPGRPLDDQAPVVAA